jgi:hypothetical protein
MAEPSALWSLRAVVFDKTISSTQNVILCQAWVALDAVINRIDRLRELIATYPNFIDFYPHPEIPPTLSDLAFQQGLASTILFNDAPRGQRESSAAYKLRRSRLAYVKQKCGGIQISVLPNRQVRNSLVHIDEYLVRQMARPKTGWLVDSAIGRRDQFTAAHHGIVVAFCRTYIASEDVLVHFDNEISLTELRREANEVRERFTEHHTRRCLHSSVIAAEVLNLGLLKRGHNEAINFFTGQEYGVINEFCHLPDKGEILAWRAGRCFPL